jgi:hypothetical protein
MVPSEMSGWELNEVWMEILARCARTPRNWKQMAPRLKTKWIYNCDEAARLKFDQFLRGEYVLPPRAVRKSTKPTQDKSFERTRLEGGCVLYRPSSWRTRMTSPV